jgi:hypothetical protein
VAHANHQLAILLDRFLYLSARFTHPPGRNATDVARAHFDQAQRELFNLAQAICALANPTVQRKLDLLREEIMVQLGLELRTRATGASIMRRSHPRPILWWEYQITPELSHDPTIVGNAVLKPYVKKLKEALRAQAAVIRARSSSPF